MTITHRTFAAAYRARDAMNLQGLSGTRPQEDACASQSFGAAGILTSAPWEGLYMEYFNTAESCVKEAAPTRTELERFLSSLMIVE